MVVVVAHDLHDLVVPLFGTRLHHGLQITSCHARWPHMVRAHRVGAASMQPEVDVKTVHLERQLRLRRPHGSHLHW